MRAMLAGFIVAGSLGIAGTANGADGIVGMSWNGCAPVVRDISSREPGIYSLYVSVHGMDVPHKGYHVAIVYGNASQIVPDAWRFDPVGCQSTNYVTIGHIPPPAVATTCPAFQATTASVQVKDISLVRDASEGYPLTNMEISLFNAYPFGNATVDPTTRYFLERVVFDHEYSVTGAGEPGMNCGGFEESICFKLARAWYLDFDGVEHDFGRDGGEAAIPVLTFNGPEACVGATPVRSTTWGSLKNQYR
jgi:hypothetical protein